MPDKLDLIDRIVIGSIAMLIGTFVYLAADSKATLFEILLIMGLYFSTHSFMQPYIQKLKIFEHREIWAILIRLVFEVFAISIILWLFASFGFVHFSVTPVLVASFFLAFYGLVMTCLT